VRHLFLRQSRFTMAIGRSFLITKIMFNHPVLLEMDSKYKRRKDHGLEWTETDMRLLSFGCRQFVVFSFRPKRFDSVDEVHPLHFHHQSASFGTKKTKRFLRNKKNNTIMPLLRCIPFLLPSIYCNIFSTPR
jgi:hypothetical protein